VTLDLICECSHRRSAHVCGPSGGECKPSCGCQRFRLATRPPEPPRCICIRFSDTGGFRIADLCCPVHGVNGTEPGDEYWEEGA